MPKTLEGYVGSGAGAPLDAIAATVTKVADGSVVTTGATGPDGRWRFPGLPVADEYFVTLVDGAGRAVVRGPWSGELREVWVRDRLDMPAAAVAVLPPGANAYLGTLAFDPPTGAGALDARYVNTTGDTMTGPLVVPGLTVGGNDMSQATLDARYVNTAGDAMSGALTVPGLSVAGNDISYPSLDARYVNTAGDAMTGALAVPSLTVAGVPINQTTLDARYVNVTGDAMSGPLTIGGLAVAVAPDPGNVLTWGAGGFYVPTPTGGGAGGGTNAAAWVTRGATQSIPNATDTPVSFDTENRDDGGYWASGSPTRLTIATTGWYGFAGWIIFEANTTGIRYVHLKRNNVDFLATTSSGPHAADGSARLTVAMNLYLVAGDYIEMIAFHNRGVGTTLNINAGLSVVGLGAAVAGGGVDAYTKTESDARYPLKTDTDPYPGYLTQAEGDARYPLKTDADPYPSYLTQTEGDARYPLKTDPDPYPTYLTQAEGDARYTQGGITQAAADLRYEPIDTMYTKAEDDARFVNLAGGSVMTGLLGPTTTNTRDLGTTALRWRKLWAVDGEFTNVPTVGGVALPTVATADAAYVNVAGDTMTGPLLLPDGSVSAPSVGFANDTNNGLRISASDTWRLVAGGVDIAQIGAGGVSVVTGSLFTPALSVNSRPVAMAGCRVYHNTTQPITTATPTAMNFNSERYDTDNFHDTVTNNNRLTVPAGLAGKYQITGYVAWGGNATGRRDVLIRVNGATYIAAVNGLPPDASAFNMPPVPATYDLAVGDYVELVVQQASGTTINALSVGNYGGEFGMQRIG